MKKDYKAILTVHDLEKMSFKERNQLVNWLTKTATTLLKSEEKYATVARFKLMK